MDFLHPAPWEADERDGVIDDYLRTMLLRADLRWARRAVDRQSFVNDDIPAAARSRGLGLVLAFMHHGHYDGALGALRKLQPGIGPVSILVDPQHLSTGAPSWSRQHLSIVSRGGELVTAAVGVSGVVDMVKAGRTVAIATDVPGKTRLRFADRQVLGVSGAARASLLSGAPVVVMHCLKEADGQMTVRFSEPLVPRQEESVEALAQRVVSLQERRVLEWCGGSDLPLLRWNLPDAQSGRVPLHRKFPI